MILLCGMNRVIKNQMESKLSKDMQTFWSIIPNNKKILTNIFSKKIKIWLW